MFFQLLCFKIRHWSVSTVLDDGKDFEYWFVKCKRHFWYRHTHMTYLLHENKKIKTFINRNSEMLYMVGVKLALLQSDTKGWNGWEYLREFNLIFFFVTLWNLLNFFLLMTYGIKNRNMYHPILYSHFSKINTPFLLIAVQYGILT